MDNRGQVEKLDMKTGFTGPEKVVIDKLQECYQAFIKLERQHTDELRDFIDAIHRIQDLMAVRIVRRIYPEGWPTYEVKS